MWSVPVVDDVVVPVVDPVVDGVVVPVVDDVVVPVVDPVVEVPSIRLSTMWSPVTSGGRCVVAPVAEVSVPPVTLPAGTVPPASVPPIRSSRSRLRR